MINMATKKTFKKNDPFMYITYYPSLKLKLSEDDDLYLHHRRPIYSSYLVEDYGSLPKKHISHRAEDITSQMSKKGRLYNLSNNPVDIADIKKYKKYSVGLSPKTYADASRKGGHKMRTLLDSPDNGGLQSWEEYQDLRRSFVYDELVNAARRIRARRKRSGKTSLRR